MYTISKLAKEADVGVETIRFYERKNLLQQPIKPIQGYRQYSHQALSRVLFIKRAQHLGFTLAEISSLLTLSANNCDDVQHLAEHKLRLIEDKLNDLLRLKESLVSLVSDCKNNPSNNDCPIIQSLQPNNNAMT
jgi:MerR family mercuric resistance operon transcriptional regulator